MMCPWEIWIVIKAGERIPLDGRVISGDSMIDTSALTGESVPQKGQRGDEVISGCVNGSGLLRVEVTKEFDDSTVARILNWWKMPAAKGAGGELLSPVLQDIIRLQLW